MVPDDENGRGFESGDEEQGTCETRRARGRRRQRCNVQRRHAFVVAADESPISRRLSPSAKVLARAPSLRSFLTLKPAIARGPP